MDSQTDDLTQGIRAFQRGDYNLAYAKLIPLAERGELRAQIIVSRLYYAGNGVIKDYHKHLYWLRRAAENGDKASKSQLKRLEKQGSERTTPIEIQFTGLQGSSPSDPLPMCSQADPIPPPHN